MIPCIQLGTIHQSLTVNKGIELMNSFIEKTNLQDKLKQFQMTQNLGKIHWSIEKLESDGGAVSLR